MHSLHAYFLRPGDPTVPIVYEVDRIRDGRSFTTRRVVAIQHGRAIFNLPASFQVDEDGPEHQDPMPDVPDPETLPDVPRSGSRRTPTGSRPTCVEWLERERPIDTRPTELPRWLDPEPGEREPSRTSGSAPTARCPTIRCCTRASSCTRPTSRCSTPRCCRTRSSWDDDRS